MQLLPLKLAAPVRLSRSVCKQREGGDMPKLARPLSDAQIKRARPGPRLVKLYDGHGLYLERA